MVIQTVFYEHNRFGQKLGSFYVLQKKGTLDPLKEKFETRIAAYDYTLEKLGKRIFALEDNLETALHKILEQQNTIKKLSYAQVTTLTRGLHPKMSDIQFAHVPKCQKIIRRT